MSPAGNAAKLLFLPGTRSSLSWAPKAESFDSNAVSLLCFHNNIHSGSPFSSNYFIFFRPVRLFNPPVIVNKPHHNRCQNRICIMEGQNRDFNSQQYRMLLRRSPAATAISKLSIMKKKSPQSSQDKSCGRACAAWDTDSPVSCVCCRIESIFRKARIIYLQVRPISGSALRGH